VEVVGRLHDAASEVAKVKDQILAGRVLGAADVAMKGMPDLVETLFTYLSILLLELLVMPITILVVARLVGGEMGKFVFPLERFKR
jgi:hypothetical protein